MYTIKEAAGILGMTKPGIRYRITALKIPLNKDAFGRIMLSDDDLQWIREGKKPEREPESGEKKEKEPEREAENTGKNSEESERKPEETGKNEKEAESGVTAALVEMLREELRVKNAQIKSLTAQLSDTTEALKSAQRSLEQEQTSLKQAQILHAKSVNLLPDAQTEPEPEDGKEAETRTQPGEDTKPRKKTLWERITGKG